MIGVAAANAALNTVISPRRFGDTRLIAAGALFLLVVLIAGSVLRQLLRPLTRPLPTADFTSRPAPASPLATSASPGGGTQATPVTAEKALAQVTNAAIRNAELAAAAESYLIDRGRYLDVADGWGGYPEGDATLCIAPGSVLHYRHDPNRIHLADFALYTSASATPVEINSISDIHRSLRDLTAAPSPGRSALSRAARIARTTRNPSPWPHPPSRSDGPAVPPHPEPGGAVRRTGQPARRTEARRPSPSLWPWPPRDGAHVPRPRPPGPGPDRSVRRRARALRPTHLEDLMSHRQLRTPEHRLTAAKRDLGLPVIVAICGSTRFMAQMNEAELRETAAGRIVVKPGCDLKNPHPLWADPARAERLKADLDELHRAKIRLADEVLIVGDYVGNSTRSEIRYARALGKPVRFTHPEADPEPSQLPAAPYEILINGAGGTLSLPAVEPVPGLHVYELPVEHREEDDGAANPWRLGHHSGKVLAAFPSEDDALRAAREVADLTDWTRPAEDLRTNEDLDLDEYVDRIETRTNGLLIIPHREMTR